MRASISSAWELLGVEEIQLSTETADQGPAPSCVEVPSGGRHIGSQQAVALSPSEIKNQTAVYQKLYPTCAFTRA